jgi:hypothetical protein
MPEFSRLAKAGVGCVPPSSMNDGCSAFRTRNQRVRRGVYKEAAHPGIEMDHKALIVRVDENGECGAKAEERTT